MSRRASRTDSLDLLLDTICNTFGGVLFIAILVVILLQLSSESQSTPRQQAVSPDAYRQLQNRHAAATSELAELRKAAASRADMLAEFAPAEFRDLVHERRMRASERDRVRRKLDALTAENIKVAEETTRTRSTNAALKRSVAQARKHQRTLETQIQKNRKDRTREMALPVTKGIFAKEGVGVILRYGRMYVWHRYSQFGLRLGLNTDEFVVVGEDEETGGLVTQPKPTAGIPLDDSQATQQAIHDRLAPFSPADRYITVVVRPDSFAQFQYVRNALIEMGFKYRLMPAAEGTAIVDRGGTGGKVQ